MIDYLFNGLEIFLLGVGLLVVLNNAPARWRLWLSIVALGATLTPWHLLPALHIPIVVYQEPGVALQSIVATSAGSNQASSLPIWAVAVALPGVGLLGFTAIVARQILRLRRWRSIAQRNDGILELAPTQTPRNCRVWVIPNSKEAGTTELPHPEIWIGDYFLREPRLSTVVTHEVCHVIANDPKIEWMLVLARSLFWWHPLAWFWVWQARRQMELACDERCAIELGQRASTLR